MSYIDHRCMDYKLTNHFTNILSQCSISIMVKEFISPRCSRLATSFVDQMRLGPNTMARLDAVILFTVPWSATWGGGGGGGEGRERDVFSQ